MQDEMQKMIAADLGISDLPEAEQQALISEFGAIALKAATVTILEQLALEKRGDFAKLAESGDAAALGAFLDREVPSHEELAKKAVAEEVKRFKEFQASK